MAVPYKGLCLSDGLDTHENKKYRNILRSVIIRFIRLPLRH
jgi:hypothetical protein